MLVSSIKSNPLGNFRATCFLRMYWDVLNNVNWFHRAFNFSFIVLVAHASFGVNFISIKSWL